MGVFDEYAGVQLKVSEHGGMIERNIGDVVDIPDGLYVGWEGVVVIHQSVLIATYPNVTTKWGSEVSAESVLHAISGLGPEAVSAGRPAAGG